MLYKKIASRQRQPVILFADDDAICLEVGIKMLQKLGYKVLDAKDGQMVIEVFKNNRSEVDLVILDMKMPYNGSSAFEKLKKIDADVKIIIASGYSVDQRIRKMLQQGCLGFIQKPFTISSLSEEIINALTN